MYKWIADDFREAFLNPIDYEEPSEPEPQFPPFKPREVKEQILQWWQMGKCATWIINTMTNDHSWFYCMTNSTVERWKLAIIAHDRRLKG